MSKYIGIATGSFGRTDVFELVGLHLLHKLSSLIRSKIVGQFRDDGLAAINSSSGPILGKMRKNIIVLFKNQRLSINIELNLFETDFLDQIFYLVTGKFFLIQKA